jgi:hypothetical protein
VKKIPVATIAIVATGDIYVNYARNLIYSLSKHFCLGSDFQILLFTDVNDLELEVGQRVQLDLKKIPAMSWPHASLDRFKIIYDNRSLIKSERLIYLDSDLRLISEIKRSDEILKKDIFFVEHPGFHNRDLFRNLYKRFVNVSWESNRKSKAFVRLTKRKYYVYGAIFGGTTKSILEMCAALKGRILDDEKINFYARSYDESHLNFWFTLCNDESLLSPEYAYVPDYPWLKHLQNPKIEAITKEDLEVLDKEMKEPKFREKFNS